MRLSMMWGVIKLGCLEFRGLVSILLESQRMVGIESEE